MTTSRRTTTARAVRLLLGAILAVASITVGTSAAEASHACPQGWGSLPESAGPSGTEIGRVTNVRSGAHRCFDRLVIDIDGPGPGYHVAYVDQVHAPGSGEPVTLDGGAFLEIVVGAPAYDVDTGQPTFDPADPHELVDVTGYRTFRQTALAGSFEGETTLGLGVRARLPFRVFVLDGPGDGSRLVIDVAHRW